MKSLILLFFVLVTEVTYSSVQLSSRGRCTLRGPDPGKKCQFPFNLNGVRHTKCVVSEERGKHAWCPTKTDRKGNIVGRESWGFCGNCKSISSVEKNLKTTDKPLCKRNQRERCSPSDNKKNCVPCRSRRGRAGSKGAPAKQEHRCDFDSHVKHGSGKGRSGTEVGFKPWPNNNVPYEFDSSFNKNDQATFMKAVEQIEKVTCVTFSKRSGEEYYLKVIRECPCTTNKKCFAGGWVDILGAGAPTGLWIGKTCMEPTNQYDVGLVIHEIMHALGFIHTQQRPDRNSTLSVFEKNIEDNNGARYQYAMCKDCSTHNSAYDCMSIMHYRAHFFRRSTACNRRNPEACPMVAKDPSVCDLWSHNNVMTKADIDIINEVYNCKPKKTCQGACGGESSDGCWCDEDCVQNGDCCPDKKDVCPHLTCRNTECNDIVIDQKSGEFCYCDNECVKHNDCCADFNIYCGV